TERPSRAGDHDRPDLRSARVLERDPQPRVHRLVERVKDLGPFQRDREDGAIAGGLHLGHVQTLRRSAAPRAGGSLAGWHPCPTATRSTASLPTRRRRSTRTPALCRAWPRSCLPPSPTFASSG